ncbi:MAG: N-6 DNA methylase, partial [Bacteroidota bacterium]
MERILFLYFLQKKGWVESTFAEHNKDFYSELSEWKALFENQHFEGLFQFFDNYPFILTEGSPEEKETAIDPEILGHIFENLLEENKKSGTFYTPKEVVHFMTQDAILLYLSKKLSLQNTAGQQLLKDFIRYKQPNSMVRQHTGKILAALDSLRVCDPAIGSGAFPMSMLLEISSIKIQLHRMMNPGTPPDPVEVKEYILRNNLYGVDIDKDAIGITRLRCWLSMIADLDNPKPLPNLDQIFEQGDSIGNYNFENESFDIVLANPPYGIKTDGTTYTNSGLGSKDSYGFFIKLAIEKLLKPNGTLVAIVSDTWLTIKTHLDLRKLVLKNQLHKVIRLPPDAFGAVVNTCILSLSKASPNKTSALIAADLTNLGIRKHQAEFSEKCWNLETFAPACNQRYAVYKYDQSIISTYPHHPIFTASPRLFSLMKDRKTARLGDVADIKVGLQTGDNQYYLLQEPDVHGNYTDITPFMDFVLTGADLSRIHTNESLRIKIIERGIHKSKDEINFDQDCWFEGRYIVPYDKGGGSDTEEGWLPNYFVPGGYFIDWSAQCAAALIRQKKIRDKSSRPYPRNRNFYFKPGLTYSRTGHYSPTFRVGLGGVFDDKSCSIFIKEGLDLYATLAVCSSRLFKFLFKNFLGHTVDSQIDDLKKMPFLISANANQLSELVES